MPFIKMHGLGNDFIILDLKETALPDQTALQALANRRLGIGCDQILTIEAPRNAQADLLMRIYNPDGSEAGACGNGTRCVARLHMDQTGKSSCVIETIAGLLACRNVGDQVEADMGTPRLEWQDIPLAEARDTLHLGVMGGPLPDPVAVSMGNPHVVFFVDDVNGFDISTLGPQVERHVLFPERTNVEFAQVLSPEKIRMRIWERGAGITQACGSGACATIVAAVRRGLTGRKAEIILDGGSLYLEWQSTNSHVLMTGPAQYVYEGRFANQERIGL